MEPTKPKKPLLMPQPQRRGFKVPVTGPEPTDTRVLVFDWRSWMISPPRKDIN